jgi:hypothetical protein
MEKIKRILLLSKNVKNKILYIFHVDLLDINYSDSKKKINYKNSNHFLLDLVNSMIDCIFCLLAAILYDIFFLFKNNSLKNRILFFYDSINQYNALESIKSRTRGSLFVGMSRNSENRLYMSFGYLISFLFLPFFLLKFFNLSKEYQSKVLRNFSKYFFILGVLFWWIFLLKILKIKSIFFSNDHLVYHRVLRMAAHINKIPTIYIQHAAVTDKFPKLEFEFSLLEGRDSFYKYSLKKHNSKIKLIGMPRFDKFYHRINYGKKIESIGICTNILDKENDIINICKTLTIFCKEKLKLPIYIRPHPRDTRNNFYQKISKLYKVKLSDPIKENSFEFLSRVDLIIAGDSSIHLEAVLMNVYPLYYSVVGKDYYGFLKNGLIKDSFNKANLQDLCLKIKNLRINRPYIRSRAQYYVFNVGTEYDGKSTEIAIKFIKENLFQKKL